MSTVKKNPSSFMRPTTTPTVSRLDRLLSRDATPTHSVNTSKADAPPDIGFQIFRDERIYGVGERVKLPLKLVIPDPLQPRAHYPEADLITLKNSLSSEGQLTAVQVYPADEEGNFMLRSGERRTRAMRSLQRDFIDAEIVERPADLFESYRRARAINLEQRSHTHLDDAVRFRELLIKVPNMNQQTLASQLDLSTSTVSKCLSVGELPNDILELMAENISNFGPSAAHAIYRYWTKTGENFHEILTLTQRVIDEKLSVRLLDTFVDASVQKREKLTRDRALSRAVFSGMASGELKAFDGKIKLTLTGLSDQNRSAFFQKIVALFQEQGLSVESATPADEQK